MSGRKLKCGSRRTGRRPERRSDALATAGRLGRDRAPIAATRPSALPAGCEQERCHFCATRITGLAPAGRLDRLGEQLSYPLRWRLVFVSALAHRQAGEEVEHVFGLHPAPQRCLREVADLAERQLAAERVRFAAALPLTGRTCASRLPAVPRPAVWSPGTTVTSPRCNEITPDIRSSFSSRPCEALDGGPVGRPVSASTITPMCSLIKFMMPTSVS